MTARASSPPPDRRRSTPALAVPQGEGRLVHALTQLGGRTLHAVRRLEREARAGESPATPLILIAAMGIGVWTAVVVVIGLATLAASLLG